MSLAKKCDTRDRLSAGRNRSQHSFRPVSRTDRANCSGIDADGAGANRQSFAEDFLLEHTHPGLRITLIGMAADSGTSPREQNQSAQCYGFPS